MNVYKNNLHNTAATKKKTKKSINRSNDLKLHNNLKNVPLHRNFFFIKNKLINHFMVDGKKSKAEKIFKEFYENLCLYCKKKNQCAEDFFLSTFKKIIPCVDVCTIRKGKRILKIPHTISAKRRIFLSIKWLNEIIRKKNQKQSKVLADIFFQTFENKGDLLKKKEAVHVEAIKNRTFMNFRSS